uniref:Uncharacterized protein n=1 Tax=Biomphalaria glabrata TaxID=6526 RepID=A0A2C9KA31_BIOGL
MDKTITCLLLVFGVLKLALSARLAVSGNHFTFNGQRVFLSGGNLPWIQYAHDFGDHQWASRKSAVNSQLAALKAAGGNSLRLWIHIQGETTPAFDGNGYVTAPDHQGTLINDFKDMLNLAQSHDILVFPTLWNAAVNQDNSHRLDGLIVDERKLQSYIDKVLTPLATAVKGHPALGAWDIMNEPEGMINPDIMSLLQGKLDFYQVHSYSYQGNFDNVSPFKHSAGDFGTGKPIVVGEFWEQDGGGMNINQLFEYVYNHGYAGAWSWDLQAHGANQRGGISHIKGLTSNGVIPINV